MEDGLDRGPAPDQNTVCIGYEIANKMSYVNLDMITILNCNTCMKGMIILDPKIAADQFELVMQYGCVPVYMSTTCTRCTSKIMMENDFTIPSGFPIATSMVQSSTTFNRFISAYGVWPKIAGTSFHRVMHPIDVVNAIPDGSRFLSIIQKGIMDMEAIECEMGEFF